MDKDNKVASVVFDWDTNAQIENLTDKLNELIAAHNALEDRIHSLEINKGGR